MGTVRVFVHVGNASFIIVLSSKMSTKKPFYPTNYTIMHQALHQRPARGQGRPGAGQPAAAARRVRALGHAHAQGGHEVRQRADRDQRRDGVDRAEHRQVLPELEGDREL